MENNDNYLISIDFQEIYIIGIIDILNKYTVHKKLEKWGKRI